MANYEIGTSYQNKQNRAKAMALLEILHEKEKHLFHVEVIDTEHKNAVMAFYSVKENKNKIDWELNGSIDIQNTITRVKRVMFADGSNYVINKIK